MPRSDALSGEILLYQRDDGQLALEVRLDDETVWVRQPQLVELFQSSKAISASTSAISLRTSSRSPSRTESLASTETRNTTVYTEIRACMLVCVGVGS